MDAESLNLIIGLKRKALAVLQSKYSVAVAERSTGVAHEALEGIQQLEADLDELQAALVAATPAAPRTDCEGCGGFIWPESTHHPFCDSCFEKQEKSKKEKE